jgi:hypothetical protein
LKQYFADNPSGTKTSRTVEKSRRTGRTPESEKAQPFGCRWLLLTRALLFINPKREIPQYILEFAMNVTWLLSGLRNQGQCFDSLTARLYMVDPQGRAKFLSGIKSRSIRAVLQKSLQRAVRVSEGKQP